MQSVRIALAVAMALVILAIVAVLSHSPLTVVGANAVEAPNLPNAYVSGGTTSCQSGGTIPSGTSAIRISLGASLGPRIAVEVFAGSHLVSGGMRPAGGGENVSSTVPVRPISSAVRNARICIRLGPSEEAIGIRGIVERTTGEPPSSRTESVNLRMEYLRPSSQSWWSRASSIIYRFGLGRAPSGMWVGFLVIALMLAATVVVLHRTLADLQWKMPDVVRGAAGRSTRRHLAAESISRDQTRSPVPATRTSATRLVTTARPSFHSPHVFRLVPPTAWVCALVAFVSAACWSVVTPPFQATDEPTHFAYTQYAVEHGQLPTSRKGSISPEEEVVLVDLRQPLIRWHTENHTFSSAFEQRKLQEDLAWRPGRRGDGVGGSAADPPLYYLLEAVPYELASAGTLLDQLELMRLLSAALAALAALFVFLFIRESLPGVPWAWTVGGLSIALSPLLGSASGAVNPDSLLFAESAAIFYCLARGFRRGLTNRLAIAIGALIAAGFLTKPNFIGLMPGVALGLIVLTFRRGPVRGGPATSLLAIAIAASPVCIYIFANLLAGRPGLGTASENLSAAQGRSVFSDLSYVWQSFLPRLPGMSNYFHGISAPIQLWFDRFVGLYGWLDTTFPLWVCTAAMFPACLIVLLAARALVAARASLRGRLVEIAVYIVMAVGLVALIASHAYLNASGEGGFGDAEPRYLLPLLPLLGVVVALAARGAGRRWGPAVGALVVVLFLSHDIFSQLIVVSRFYG